MHSVRTTDCWLWEAMCLHMNAQMNVSRSTGFVVYRLMTSENIIVTPFHTANKERQHMYVSLYPDRVQGMHHRHIKRIISSYSSWLHVWECHVLAWNMSCHDQSCPCWHGIYHGVNITYYHPPCYHDKFIFERPWDNNIFQWSGRTDIIWIQPHYYEKGIHEIMGWTCDFSMYSTYVVTVWGPVFLVLFFCYAFCYIIFIRV